MKSTFIGAILLAPLLLLAQQHHHSCASFDVLQHWEQQYPGTIEKLDAVLLNAKHYNPKKANAGSRSTGNLVYRIPVVVHIVYTSPAENLHDSLVYNQLEVLNNAFRRDSPDTVFTRDVFKPFAGDAGIEFYLATEDPNGNPTTGITRTSTVQPGGFGGFSPFNDAMKKAADGGINAWPTDRYLNIWVCDINSQPFLGSVLGYAYPPIGNLSNWPANAAPADTTVQGVVIYHKVFGRNNPLAANDPMLRDVSLGKTTVHEVGHYLGLRHIWGENAANPFAPGACNLDDFVHDTPPTINRSEQECDLTKNECGPVCPNYPDLPDMIENYMDYSVDSCNNMFTHGQIAIMRNVLALYRPNLGEATPGNIKPVHTGPIVDDFDINSNDSLVLLVGYSSFTGSGAFPTAINFGDTLFSSNGVIIPDSCGTIVLYPGEYLVNAAGDTLFFNIGDTLNSFEGGLITTKAYVPLIGVGNIEASSFKLYPNPTSGVLNISVEHGKNATVSVTNLLGEVLLEQAIPASGNTTLNLSHLASGVYLVQLQSPAGVTAQRVVIE